MSNFANISIGHRREKSKVWMNAFGGREAVVDVVSGEDLWYGVTSQIPLMADAGEQLSIVSDSVEDKHPDFDDGGTHSGAHTVSHVYIDELGFEREELIKLHGTTPVNLVTPKSRHSQLMHVQEAGIDETGTKPGIGATVGNVKIYRTGTVLRVYQILPAGRNFSQSTQRMVPKGKTLKIDKRGFSGADKSVNIVLRSTDHDGILTPRIFHFKEDFSSNNAGSDRSNGGIVIPELSIIKMSVFVPAGKDGADVSGYWHGYYL